MAVELQYGVHDGKIVCISDLTNDQRGLLCDCTCPYCGQPLQAKLGTIRQHHFAHDNHTCNIAIAQQTALHQLAKEIIFEEKHILLPPLEVTRKDAVKDAEFLYVKYPPKLTYKKACDKPCTDVILEHKISNIIPDLIVTFGHRQCLIEIAVTHFVDEEKKKKIKELDLPVIEIDLSSLYQNDVVPDRKAIQTAILSDINNRKWIYNPKQEEAISWAHEQYDTFLTQDEEKEAQERKIEEQKQKEQLRKQEIQKQKRATTSAKLEALFIPSNYQRNLKALRNDACLDDISKTCSFAKYCKDRLSLPFFVDVPITGEMIFQCDHRLWQSMIFDHFVFNRNEQHGDGIVVVERIQSWLKHHQKAIKIDWSLAPKALAHCNQKQTKAFYLFYDVINSYLEYLCEIGFLSRQYSGHYAINAAHTIIPPDQKNAEMILAFLGQINPYEPNISEIIKQKFNETKKVEMQLPSDYLNMEAEPYIPSHKNALSNSPPPAEPVLNLPTIHPDDFASDVPIYAPDRPNTRLAICTKCHMVFYEQDMPYRNGNYGTCRNCKGKEHE